MSTQRFDKERKRYKEIYEQKLNELLRFDRTQNIIKKFKLTNYKFIVAKPKHFQTVIELMLKVYAKINPIQILFDSRFEPMMVSSITPKLKAGRCIIAIDQGNNNIFK